jgi:glutamine synthetase
MDTGVGVLPKLPRDAGDRNRTSPFAFTGNKFEFRAVSANQAISLPNIALNVAVTDSLDYCATEIEASLKAGKKLDEAVKLLLSKVIKDSKRIIFNGNNYSDDWQKEAGKRGLLNLRTSIEAFGESLKPDVVQAFERYGVLNERELKARHEVALEQYNKTINIEAQLMALMANRSILPAAYRFQGELAQTVSAVKAAGASARESRRALDELTGLVDAFRSRTQVLQKLLEHEENGDAMKHAKYFRDKVIPAMASLREAGDALEGLVPQDLWPLPTYREMLFVK